MAIDFYKKYEQFSRYNLTEEDYYEHDRSGNRRNFEIKYFDSISPTILKEKDSLKEETLSCLE